MKYYTLNILTPETYKSLMLTDKSTGTIVEEYSYNFNNKKKEVTLIINLNDKKIKYVNKNDRNVKIEKEYELNKTCLFYENQKNTSGKEEIIVLYHEIINTTPSVYKLKNSETIVSIGYDDNVTIKVPDNKRGISRNHFRLRYNSVTWSISDYENAKFKFLYINQKNLYEYKQTELGFGDNIFIFGLRILLCDGYLVLYSAHFTCEIEKNMPDINRSLESMRDTNINLSLANLEKYASLPSEIVNQPQIPKFELAKPPEFQREKQMSMAQLIGMPIAMGMTSLVMLSFQLMRIIEKAKELTPPNSKIDLGLVPITDWQMVIMPFAMLLSSVILPIWMRKDNRKFETHDKDILIKNYRNYLITFKNQIESTVKSHLENIKKANDKDITAITKSSDYYWQKYYERDDFLLLYLGEGETFDNIEISYNNKQNPQNSINEDYFKQDIKNVLAKKSLPELNIEKIQAPILLNFKNVVCSGITAENTSKSREFTMSLLMETIFTHSPYYLKIAVICNENQLNFWSQIKYMPHIFNSEFTERYLATNTTEVIQLLKKLEVIFEDTKEKQLHYFIIVDDYTAVSTQNILKKMLNEKDPNFSFLFVSGENKFNFPQENTQIIKMIDNKIEVYKDSNFTDVTSIVSEPFFIKQSHKRTLIEQIQNMRSNFSGLSEFSETINSLDFFGLFKIGKVDELNLLKLYEDSIAD